MNIIKNIYKNSNKSTTQLGRWFINQDKKIYLANYDHCGPCGFLDIKK